MRSPGWFTVGLLLALALALALAPTPAGGEPAPRRVPAEVSAARARLRAEDRGGAIALLEQAGGARPDAPERSWLLAGLRQTLWQQPLARREALALPPSDLRAALLAFLAQDAEPALRGLDRSRRPPVPWSDLSAAHLLVRLGRKPQALGRAQAVLLAGPAPLAALEAHHLRSRVLLDLGRLVEAKREVERALSYDPGDARLHALQGEVQRRRGDGAGAQASCLHALELAPESESAARRLGELLREPGSTVPGHALGLRLTAVAARAPANVELHGLRAHVAAAQGHTDAAIALYRQALAGGAVPIPLQRELRAALAQRGQWAEVLDLLLDVVPRELLDDPRNLRKGAWDELRRAHAALHRGEAAVRWDPLATAQALTRVGALQEAAALLRAIEVPEAAWLRARIAGHLAFEAALRDVLEGGYRAAHADRSPPTLDTVLHVLARLARQHLVPEDQGAFLRPGLGRRDMPLLGAWLDHGTDSSSPVVRHFREMGRYLMLGQRSGEPPEAIVFSLAYLTQGQEIRTAGRVYRHDVAVGYDRDARSFVAAQGGDLGGACLADGVWLDADSARRGDGLMRRLLARDPALWAAMHAWQPVAADGPQGVLTIGDPGPLAYRLMARVLERRGDDPWAGFGTLRAHEFAHVADIRRHLPLLDGLPATLLLLARAGFAPERAEMELERRAQLGAIVDAPDADLALAEMLEMLPLEEDAPEVHAGGYRQALRDLVRYVHARPDLFPDVDRTRWILPQLEFVSLDALRQAAAALCGPGRIEPW